MRAKALGLFAIAGQCGAVGAAHKSCTREVL